MGKQSVVCIYVQKESGHNMPYPKMHMVSVSEAMLYAQKCKTK